MCETVKYTYCRGSRDSTWRSSWALLRLLNLERSLSALRFSCRSTSHDMKRHDWPRCREIRLKMLKRCSPLPTWAPRITWIYHRSRTTFLRIHHFPIRFVIQVDWFSFEFLRKFSHKMLHTQTQPHVNVTAQATRNRLVKVLHCGTTCLNSLS